MDVHAAADIRGVEVHPLAFELVVAALKELDPQPRTRRWGHLPLALIDAVFSINSTYAATAAAVRRYASWAQLDDVLVPCPYDSTVLRPGEQTITGFLESIKGISADELAGIYGNRNRTSTHRTSILKAEAVTAMALVLAAERIETLPDAARLLEDETRLAAVDRKLNKVRGSGLDGVRTGYL